MKNIFANYFSELHRKFLFRSVLVLTVGVIGFETITFYQMSQTIRTLTLQNMKNTVKNAATKINDEISRLNSDLEVISSLPALEAYYLNSQYGLVDEAEQYKNSLYSFFSKQSSRNQAYLAYKICDPQLKKMTMYSGQDFIHKSISDQKCLNNSSIITRKHFPQEQLIDRPTLIVNQQVFRNDLLLGTIEIYFDLTAYFTMVDSQSLNESGFVAVVDKDGLMLSTTNNERISLGKHVNKNLSTSQSSNDFEIVSDLMNQDVLLYRTSLDSIDWSIYAFVLEKEIFASLYTQFQVSSVLIITMIILELIFLSYFTKNLITQRITSILNATKNILSGSFQYRIPIQGNDEISQLGSSFNQMTDSLQEQMNKLQKEQSNLYQSKQQLQNIIDHTSALVTIKDLQGRYQLVNTAYEHFYGLDSHDIIGKVDQQIFSSERANLIINNDQKVLSSSSPQDFEEVSVNKKGQLKTFLNVRFPLKNTDGITYALCCIASDISNRKEEEKALKKINAKLTLSSMVLENIIEAVLVTDADFNIIDLNPATVVQFGYSREELIGQKPSILRSDKHDDLFFDKLYGQLGADGTWHGEIWEKNKNGVVIPLLLTVVCLRDENGVITHYAGIYSDISDLKKTEARLQKLAHYDSLTGLANRLLLEERTTQAILRAKRDGHKVTMLFIDLDNFKYINDTLGHDVGDRLLVKAANRFEALLRSSDTLARQGGDEFVVLLAKTVHAHDAALIADKIKAVGSRPFNINGQELYVSTSIGIAVYPDDASSTNELFKCADMAMYSAKESGKDNYRFYSSELNHAAVNRLKIEKALRAALEKDELELYYQPQIDVQSGLVIKAEALLRWRDSSGQFIPPDLFVPIAEESGLIVVLGEWVVQRALLDLGRINQNRDQPLKISINLSARQFRHHDLARKLDNLVRAKNTSPASIEFEVTEGLLVDDFELAEKILNEIRDFGFSIALDDFGKGYSSLSYLKHFPIDTLKLDRTFMSDLISDSRTQAIVEASVTMARALGMQVVFEGAETQEQYDFIQRIGHVSVQGYFCSKPLSVDGLIKFLPTQVESI